MDILPADYDTKIDYVVGPSCSGGESCARAQIGSAYRSCRGMYSSCYKAQLSGVDLIDSCNADYACISAATGNPFVYELINCCNDEESCSGIFNGKERPYPAEWGCVSCYCDRCFFFFLHLSNSSIFLNLM